MYQKVAIKSLKSGINMQIVCFTQKKASKKKVVQDLLVRILKVARLLGIAVAFNQQSLYVEREEVPGGGLYTGEPTPPGQGEPVRTSDMERVLPPKLPWPPPSRVTFSVDGLLVVDLGTLSIDGNLFVVGDKVVICVEAALRCGTAARFERAWTREVPIVASGEDDQVELGYFEKVSLDLDNPTRALALPPAVVVKVTCRDATASSRQLGFAKIVLKDQVEKDEMEEHEVCNSEGCKIGSIRSNVFAPSGLIQSVDDEVGDYVTWLSEMSATA
jgi:hypothetical protein